MRCNKILANVRIHGSKARRGDKEGKWGKKKGKWGDTGAWWIVIGAWWRYAGGVLERYEGEMG